MHHFEPRESFSPRSLGRSRVEGVFTKVLDPDDWAGHMVNVAGKLAVPTPACPGVVPMAMPKRPSFGPGMCRKPHLGKCHDGKKIQATHHKTPLKHNKKPKKILVIGLGGCGW